MDPNRDAVHTGQETKWRQDLKTKENLYEWSSSNRCHHPDRLHCARHGAGSQVVMWALSADKAHETSSTKPLQTHGYIMNESVISFLMLQPVNGCAWYVMTGNHWEVIWMCWSVELWQPPHIVSADRLDPPFLLCQPLNCSDTSVG